MPPPNRRVSKKQHAVLADVAHDSDRRLSVTKTNDSANGFLNNNVSSFPNLSISGTNINLNESVNNDQNSNISLLRDLNVNEQNHAGEPANHCKCWF